jgi:gliding motility-associated-like protein
LVEEESTVIRTDISNQNIQLEVSSGPCLGIQDLGFRGSLDELRIYNRALNESEISELAHPIDEILTPDTLLFLGASVDIISSESCGSSFSWSPTQGVDMPNDPNTTITPDETTIYSLSYEQDNCTARDSIRISVIDPDVLDCTQLFMANGFTPNLDGKNDSYGISNPFAIEEFVSIELLDKWGNRVFYSDNKFAKWDGTFQGRDVNPGVFLYRVLYKCGGEDQYRTGSVTLLR